MNVDPESNVSFLKLLYCGPVEKTASPQGVNFKIQKRASKGNRGVAPEKIKEIFDFVCFIKAKEAIDPTQVYFWTREWKEMEREADKGKVCSQR